MKASVICFECTKTLEYLLQRLKRQGFAIDRCVIVEQKTERLEEAFKPVLEESDTVFFLGGLGLNPKDVVKEYLGKKFDRHLVYTEKSQSQFNNYHKISGAPLPAAYMQERLLSYPEGFEVFPAVYGSEMAAAGKFGGAEIVLLPENLDEVTNVCENYLEKYFRREYKNVPLTRSFKLFGLTGFEIESRLKELKKVHGDFQSVVNTDDALDSSVTVILKSTRQNDNVLPAVYENFSNEMYCDGDLSLAEVALHFLKIHQRKISIAESLTGGLICSELVSAEGAGDVLQEAFVTYSNEAKQSRLLVKAQTLALKGAVSHETAYEMAVGLLTVARCDTVMSITGLAGPGGASESKPLGRTYIALGDNRGIHVHEYTFSGSRNKVRRTAAKTALFLLVKFLKKIK